MCLIVHMIC